MSTIFAAETIEHHGCPIVLHRLVGPEASELFFTCKPPAGRAGASEQAEAVYQAVRDLLRERGATPANIVSETVFLREQQVNIDAVRAARQRVFANNTNAAAGSAVNTSSHSATHHASITEIEQAPLDAQAWLEISVQAVLPLKNTAGNALQITTASPACACTECARSQGLLVHMGHESRLYSGALYGPGNNAYEQTQAMFAFAEQMLEQANMGFGDVVRTWIYLREMERDYASLNRARREFFNQRNIHPPPASTGIGAGLVPDNHDLCLVVYAVKGTPSPQRTLMTTPTLNEAPSYGADFSRGMRVAESNRDALFVSGTASLDETGKSVNINDLEAQAARMVLNVTELLKAQGAGFGDIVSAVTYLKHAQDADRLTGKLQEQGFTGFANTMVEAPVCRPELLCECEVLAILPRGQACQNE
ncbi:MAG: Rid family hydrolase [Pseudomonadales bacterium]